MAHDSQQTPNRPPNSDTIDPLDILLIEDNEGDIRLAEELFEQSQFVDALRVARTLEDALAFLRRPGTAELQPPAVDVALLNGRLVTSARPANLRELTTMARSTFSLVLLVQSEVEAEILNDSEHGPFPTLTKPIDPDEFRRLTDEILDPDESA